MSRDGFEARLEELKRLAAAGGTGLPRPGVTSPHGASGTGYYGLPLLKRPIWTWEIPTYLFVGGAAGAASVIGAVARVSGASPELVRDARWVAALGGLASPPLLISDLGRPERFLNMLRVFKLRSAMSVGAWTLVAFTSTASASAFADLVGRRTGGRIPVRVVADAAEMLSAATGLVLSTYTGVLVGATAVPVWSKNAELLPLQFGVSGVGAAVSILELAGHYERALNRIGVGAAALDAALSVAVELDRDPAMAPLKHTWSGGVTRAGGLLSGPIPLALRVLGGRSAAARRTAAACTLVGSLLTRIGWIAAGYESVAESTPQLLASSPEQRGLTEPR